MHSEPTRAELSATRGIVVLEFGASWCPICRAARPLIDRALGTRSDLQHLWIEDGKGKPLGRSFQVKLWPTLVFLRNGEEVVRVVRPAQGDEVVSALQTLDAATAP